MKSDFQIHTRLTQTQTKAASLVLFIRASHPAVHTGFKLLIPRSHFLRSPLNRMAYIAASATTSVQAGQKARMGPCGVNIPVH